MTRTFTRVLTSLAAVALIVASLGSTSAHAASGAAGAVYAISNDAAGNTVLVFERSASGDIAFARAYSTGGLGTGAGLGSQGAVVTTANGRWLLAVNAGSDDISLFAITADGLVLTDRAGSGGMRPISVTTHGGVAYALNAGGTPNVSGFTISGGDLTPIAGSGRTLSGSGPAQIEFSPSGRVLVVTNKASSTIETLAVDEAGVAGLPTSFASHGATPFGFAFGLRDRVFVSEAAGAPAGLSATSSYSVGESGSLTLVSGSISTTQAAACWLVVTSNGRFAYTANAASDSVSSYAIDQDGSISLREARAAWAAGSHPTDMALSRGSQHLYVLEGFTRSIAAYRVGADGSLTFTGRLNGIPDTTVGLAAR